MGNLFDTIPRIKKIAKGRKVANKIKLTAFKNISQEEMGGLRDYVAETFQDICDGMDFDETVKALQDQSIAQFI